MNPSEFTLRLLLLFLPGIITTMIVDRLTVPRDTRNLYFFLNSFIYGVLAYGLYGLTLSILRGHVITSTHEMHFFKALLDTKQAIALGEIYWACGIAVFNGFLVSHIANRKFLYRIAQKLHVSKRFGDLSVWGYLHNSDTDSLRWVRIRDQSHNLCYEGWIEAFSDTVGSRELFIREVKTFSNDSGDFLYETPGIYLSLNPQEVNIEFHALETDVVVEPKDQGSQDNG